MTWLIGATQAGILGQSAASLAAPPRTERLKSAEPLSPDDLSQFIDGVGRAIGSRVVRVREGALSRQVTDLERAGAFAMLAGLLPVADGGVREIDGVIVRGLRAPATPATFEVDASQFLWVDVTTLLPKRYELLFGLPGMGDGFVDFVYDD
jgi:hypothetical protein